MRRGRVIAAVGIVAALGGGTALLALRDGTTAPTVPLGAPRFVDEATSSGLVHSYEGDTPFLVGGGLASLDCDENGLPDLFLAGGSQPAALYRNRSALGGALSFERLADAATDLPDVTGAYPLDMDGDGHTDLAVLRSGENVLLRGLGDCRFERANEQWGFAGGDARTMAFSATWEGSARLPTLAIGDYIALDELGTPLPPCPDNELHRPLADGSGFRPATALAPGYCPLSMLFSDWDRSGRRDLRISNDRQYYTDGQEQLWRIEEGSAPAAYTADDGWARMQIWGMGIASRDVTGDGYPEVYLTSQGDNKLQTLTAGPRQPAYRDIAARRGVNAAQPSTGGESLPSTAWHPEFTDVNNDGFADLFVSKGNVSEQAGYATRDPSELLIGQPDGSFTQSAETAGIVRYDRGRGAALVDLNLDGLPDLVELFLDAPVGLWRNVGTGTASDPEPMGHWIQVRLEQPSLNRDAVGAWIETRIGETMLRHEVTVGGGHLSGEAGWIHIGIGPSQRAEVRVTWPDGEIGPWQTIDAGSFSVIERGTDSLRAWTPSP